MRCVEPGLKGEQIMLLAPIPFEYAKLLDPGDRIRKSRKASSGRQVRKDRRA
jgi:hypothetical protein